MLAKVRDKKTGSERTINPRAYALMKKRYELLGYVEDDKVTPVQGASAAKQEVAAPKKKEGAEPAVESEATEPTTQDEARAIAKKLLAKPTAPVKKSTPVKKK